MRVATEVLIPPQIAYDVARRMRGLEPKPLTGRKWLAFLKSEHSPIRVATYRVYMENIPYWVSVHFSRHKIGVEHFITSRRSDITGKERSPNDLVNHEMILNAQALITMARKRLCFKASPETRVVMQAIKKSLQEPDAVLSWYLAPDCVYRNGCNELSPCGKMEIKSC